MIANRIRVNAMKRAWIAHENEVTFAASPRLTTFTAVKRLEVVVDVSLVLD